MLKDITTVKLQGANFATLTSFTLFDPIDGNRVRNVKATLLYGRNGTGKSTIAKAFRKIKGEDIPGINQTSVSDIEGNCIELTEEEKRRIFVFDEDYVYDNVRLQEDHLDTIVMLGEAADLTEKIEIAEAKRNKARNDYESQDAIYREYFDYNNPKAPKYYLSKLCSALRGDDCWAGRDKVIKDGRQNTQVRDDTYKQFVKLMPKKSKSELLVEFKEQLKALDDAKSGASTIDTVVPPFSGSYVEYDDAGVKKLLAEKIEKPELTEREKHLVELVKDGKSAELSQRIDLLRQNETETCPYCFQSISKDYKEELIGSIEKVLSKEVENHQKKLNSRIYEEINLDLIQYETLDSYKKCSGLIDLINAAVLANNGLINEKIANPYEPIVVEETSVAELAIQLDDALEELELNRKSYNAEATKTDSIIKELTRINSEIAHYDVVDYAEQYDKQSKACLEAKAINDDLKKAWEDSEKEVENLEAQRRNVQIAMDAINSCMKYIFFSDDRLRIDYADGVYKLLSHGRSVKPCDVSVGERNILGISYFFTSIMENREEKNACDQEFFLVIDDPVSSYDAENRIGILSFLKYKLGAFLEGNENTKALVMTHDLMTFYDMHKVFKEIVEDCNSIGYSNKPIFRQFELSDQTISSFKYRYRQEYTELVERVYKYARNEAEEQEPVIGNIMRQVLEAFSTFQYKMDIEHISTDNQVLELLGEPEYVSYFKNLMYRLVLHGGSHREEQVKTMQDLSFFSLISDAEKKKTARDILCFIFLLNPQHLLIHLKNCNNAESTLNRWCREIKANATVI